MVVVDKELWGEYAVGAFMILLRFYSRWHVVGFENFGLEDIFMFIALLSYSAITALIHLITNHGSTIGQTSESVYLLTDEQVASFIIGQKLTFADWFIYILYIWSLKATLLVMFTRLAKGLAREELIVKIVIGYTVVGMIGAVLTHICVCLPVHKSWQVVPYPGGKSAPTRSLHLVWIGKYSDIKQIHAHCETSITTSSAFSMRAPTLPSSPSLSPSSSKPRSHSGAAYFSSCYSVPAPSS